MTQAQSPQIPQAQWNLGDMVTWKGELGHLVGYNPEGLIFRDMRTGAVIYRVHPHDEDLVYKDLMPDWIDQSMIDALLLYVRNAHWSGPGTIQMLVLTEYQDLTRNLLATQAYRVGKDFPGKRSINGIAFVMILRWALHMSLYLAARREDIDMDLLFKDLANLQIALRRGLIYLVDIEKG